MRDTATTMLDTATTMPDIAWYPYYRHAAGGA